MRADQDEEIIEALQSIALSLQDSRIAQRASLLHTASNVVPQAREEWLRHLDVGGETEAHILAWWLWLDSQSLPTEVGQ